MAQDEVGGYVFRGEDGSLYLIRDDVLEAAKLTGEYLEYAKANEPETEGFAMSEGPFTSFNRVENVKLSTSTNLAGIKHQSTIMCAW